MNTSDCLLEQIHRVFPADKCDIRTISPLKLAYVGDAVFEIIVRTLVLDTTGGPVKKLHRKTSSLVNAATQSYIITTILPELTEQEGAVFRRGRNAKTSTMSRHADIQDYRNATGLEALYGYLYLTNQTERAVNLLKYAIERMEIPDAQKRGTNEQS
ncbi:MAG TPA: ribonuclease III [Lachnospiraceae bacterium]|nr:ribonuclease III [Lachnospiraceae bacterium]